MSDPLDPKVESKVRDSFARQSMMTSVGAHLVSVNHGEVVISAPILDGFRQQQNLAHGGLVFSLGDTAAGFAALSVMPHDMEVVTVEIKINLMAPAEGQLVAVGRV
ncbi:MAG: PaaI family thioesterase [Rhizobiaceae bacterium]